MNCPICLSKTITLIGWPGRRPSRHNELNILSLRQCELGHSFHTVTFFDGEDHPEQYAFFVETMNRINLWWD
jgi:hypothetical protein